MSKEVKCPLWALGLIVLAICLLAHASVNAKIQMAEARSMIAGAHAVFLHIGILSEQGKQEDVRELADRMVLEITQYAVTRRARQGELDYVVDLTYTTPSLMRRLKPEVVSRIKEYLEKEPNILDIFYTTQALYGEAGLLRCEREWKSNIISPSAVSIEEMPDSE